MGDNKNTNDQEEVSANADFSTQSNESYHLSLALSSTQVDQEFIIHIIEGLKSQKRFKDVSYIKIKQNSVSLKALDISQAQTIFIKVKKYQKNYLIQEKVELLKDLSNKYSQYFVQIINYWCLQSDQYDLLFQEIEYLPKTITDFFNEIAQSSQDVSEQQKSEIIIQMIRTIQLSENLSNRVPIRICLKYYLVDEHKPKLLLKAVECEDNTVDQKCEQIIKDNFKNRLVAIIESENQRLNNLQVVGILILLLTNWQNFFNQYVNDIDELTLADYILKGEVEKLVNIDKSTIYYQIYQKIMNQSCKNATDLQQFVELLQNSKQNEQSQYENSSAIKHQKKRDIYDDSEDDDDDQMEQGEINSNNYNEKNQNNKLKLNIINPNAIINRYINSISNCQLPLKHPDNSNTQSEKNESFVKSNNAEGESNDKEKIKETDIKQINQEEKVIDMEDINQNRAEQNIQTQPKFVIQNNSNVIKLNNNNRSQIDKVIVLEDFEKTPAQSHLFVSQKIDLKNTSNVVYLSNQKENQQDKRLVEDIQGTPQNTKRNSELNQNQSKIIEFSNNKNEENKIDISYNHNNDIVIEMKEVDGFAINNASQQKNFNNSEEVQNPLSSYQRYLYELGVDCEDISEIFIMEYNEKDGKEAFGCYFYALYKCFQQIMANKKEGKLFYPHFKAYLPLVYQSFESDNYAFAMHVIYCAALICLGVLLVPFGLARYFIRIYYQLSDFKSSIIYQRQNSYTWFEYDCNYLNARDFKNFCHKMMHRRYQYLQSPSKNMASF